MKAAIVPTLLLTALCVACLAGGSRAVAGCKASPKNELSNGGNAGAIATGGYGGSTGGTGGTAIGGFAPGGGAGGSEPPCVPTPDNDADGDGWTQAQGDCDDCDKNVNPNAVEVPTEQGGVPKDENCDGVTDEAAAPPCDDAIAIDEADPLTVIKAVELCKLSSGPNDWGVVAASWVLADGSPPPTAQLPQYHLGHGVLDGFGPNVGTRRGLSMLALSSGTARRPTDPGYHDVNNFDKGYTCGHPQGFPKESPACPGVTTGEPHDSAGIEVRINTPSNAYGIQFDFDFYTYEWPGYICTEYNDFFVALLDPIPPNQTDGNISFDGDGNPISVNNAFLGVCGCTGNPPSPCQAGGKTFPCPLGDLQLIGTGFGFDTAGEDHGGTSWLRTQAPVPPASEIIIRFAVYDSGDGVLDTTTLVDNFAWIAKPGTEVHTVPVPN